MRLFGSDRLMAIMDKLGMEEGQVIEHPVVTRAIEVAQKRVEAHNFDIRKQLLEYDDVMNRQREVIYSLRHSILEGEDIKERILEAVSQTVQNIVSQHLFAEGGRISWDLDALTVAFKTKFGFDLKLTSDQLNALTQEQINDLIFKGLLALYEDKEKAISSQGMRQLERILLLQTIDAKWKDHLYAMDQLKEGISLRAFAQRDPLIEYKREGFEMFEMMYQSINEEVAETIFKVQPPKEQERPKGVFSSLPQEFVHSDFSVWSARKIAQKQEPQSEDEIEEEAPTTRPYQKAGPKIGRNDPCPCGSGKKYKNCCGQ
jgi:preprotein translocase subunit SecA